MSHVKALRCDACGHIYEQDRIVGVIPVEDMYDKLKSYPTAFTEAMINRTNVHYCLNCYNERVVNAVKTDKGKHPEQYDAEITERAYMLRRECVLRPVRKPH